MSSTSPIRSVNTGSIVIGPQPGKQTDFLACTADIVIYGGAAGGGKSFGLLLDPIRYYNVRGFNAAIFRQTYGDITNPGGLWDSSYELYPLAGAVPRESKLDWNWEGGASIQFSHFQHPKYKLNWQGSQVCMIGWDELTHFSRDVFFYMLSRNRSACGVKPYVRATCNPDPDSWVKDFIQWWIDEETGFPIPERDGVIRWMLRDLGSDEVIWYDSLEAIHPDNRKFAKSVTFISASLDDNRILTDADPSYIASLMSLPKHERERLLNGNWNVRLQAGMLFRTPWFEIVGAAPLLGECVRYWDRAATEPHDSNRDPDWTAGVKLRRCDRGYFIEDSTRFRATPDRVRQNIRNTATQDGPSVTQVFQQDPGQAGVVEVKDLVRHMEGFTVRVDPVPRSSKEARAYPASAQCEAGNVKVVKGAWNKEFLNELEAFPNPLVHDDQVDGFTGAFNYLNNAPKVPRIRQL